MAKRRTELELYGLILAGGKSSRMGFNKALLNFHGKTQVEWLHGLLSKSCQQVFVSGSPEKITGSYQFIEDHFDHGGPMNGILSAFHQYPERAWLVVPVDMPHVEEAIVFLLSHRDTTRAATCLINPEDKMVEPLPVILEPLAHQILLRSFSQGKDSLNRFLSDANIIRLPGTDARWFKNINSPDDL